VGVALVLSFVIVAAGATILRDRASTGPLSDPSGTIVFSRDGALFTIDSDGTQERQLPTPIRGCADCLVWAPDGSRFAFAIEGPDQAASPAIVDRDGSSYVPLATSSRDLDLIPSAWSPGGTIIAYEAYDQDDPSRNGIYTTDVSGGRLTRITVTRNGDRDIPIAYSPDGSMILFARHGDSEEDLSRLFVVAAEGGVLTRVGGDLMVPCCFFGKPASWSPSGDRVAFAGYGTRRGNSAVYLAQADGTRLRRISGFARWITAARWSPDGRWILFDEREYHSGHDLFIVHPDGTGNRAITTVADGYGSCCGQWSPDGSKILFQRTPLAGRVDRLDLWIVGLEDGKAVQLTHSPGNYTAYHWAPEP
jgi:Tol biopolymer transport system component